MVNPVEVCIYIGICLGLKFREGCSDDGRNCLETMLRVCMQCRVLLTGAEWVEIGLGTGRTVAMIPLENPPLPSRSSKKRGQPYYYPK